MLELPASESFSDFARRLGCKPSYVTELRQAGRLVLSADGKAVQVRESLDRVRATASPEWDGVAQRHAETRGSELGASPAVVPASTGMDHDDTDDVDQPAAALAGGKPADDDQLRTRRAKRMSAELQAAQDRLDYQERIGKLVDAGEARAIGARIGTTVRLRLESYAVRISSQVEERQRAHIFAFVTDLVEQTLSDLAEDHSRAHARKDPA